MKKSLSTILILIAIISLSFGQDWAIKQLENSPRHQEDIIIKNGDKDLSCFLVYPEVSEKVTVVILIHENRGLNDWARSMADQVAGEGFIVIAPDFITGMAPNGGNTPDFPNRDEARTAIYALDADGITSGLDAVYEYAKNIPAGNGKVAVMGFCWGGSQTFRYATHSSKIKSYMVFYGTGPKDEVDYEKINAPVYGFYGGNDNRVNATIPDSKEFMREAGKIYDPVIYEGAGHGFMRAGQAPDASEDNKKARDAAFKRLIGLLKKS